MKKASLSGSILGVAFSVAVTEVAEGSITISGAAGGQPVNVNVSAGDDFISASGTLLGNEFSITGADASQ